MLQRYFEIIIFYYDLLREQIFNSKTVLCEPTRDVYKNMCYSKKNPNRGEGGFRIYFLEKNPGNFRFVTLQKLHPWKFFKTVLHPWISRPETKTLRNSSWIFLEHPWKFGAIALLRPTFLLVILVQILMLIKNHIETWVSELTETKLFTFKVL